MDPSTRAAAGQEGGGGEDGSVPCALWLAPVPLVSPGAQGLLEASLGLLTARYPAVKGQTPARAPRCTEWAARG